MSKDIVAVVLVSHQKDEPTPVGITNTNEYVDVLLNGLRLEVGGRLVPVIAGRYFGIDNPVSPLDLPRIGHEMISHAENKQPYALR
ncbi:MAG: hypothetical protein WCK29_03180 [archaeon]